MSDINDDNTDSEDYTRNNLSSNSESDLKPDIGTDILTHTYFFSVSLKISVFIIQLFICKGIE